MVPVRPFADNVVEPVSAALLEIDRRPGREGEAAIARGQEAGLANARACLTIAQPEDLLDVKGIPEPNSRESRGGVGCPGLGSSTFDFSDVGRW